MAQDCLVTPISLENKILNSDLIIEGEVISKSCSWDHAHRLIYTTYLFRIHTRFNGTAPGSHILVCTPGGIIGDTALILEPGFGMEPGEKGVLFLKPLLNLPTGVFQLPVFEPYSWTQGFYRYILQCDVAISALDYRHGIDSLKNYIVSLTRQSHVLLPAFNLPVTTVGGSGLFAPPPPPPPQIAGFSPGSISAGTMSLLTINGANFGNSPGAVSFNLAVATSGQWIPALPSEIISWTNNQIEVLVSSGAGTGSFRVTDAFGIQTLSPLPLTVIYNHLNHNNSTQRFMLRNINQSTWGGINWEVHSLLSGNMPAFNSFKRAVSTWRCATGINWTVSGSGTVNYVSFDNVSAVIWDSNLTSQNDFCERISHG